jgi:hypothetical protein
MSRHSTVSALAVLAAGGALIAGCSSSSSSASSTPTSAATSAAASATSAASSTGTGSATKPSAADCAIIGKISSGVISTLTPLQSEPPAKAAVALKAYIAKLDADQAQLSSPGGKAALGAFISALEKSSNESLSAATGTVTTAIGKLAAACA